MLATLVAPHAATGADSFRPNATASADLDTVLVVEDDEGVAALLRVILDRAGLRVLRARSASESLALFARDQDRIALAIVDFALPDGHGMRLSRHLRAQVARLPVLFVSGRDIALSEWKACGGEAPTRFVQKPFSPSEMRRVVNDLLASAAAR